MAASSWVASTSAKNPSLEQHPASALSNKINDMVNINDDDDSRLKNVVHFYMMDIQKVDNTTYNLTGDPSCFTRWDYSRYVCNKFTFRFDLLFGTF